MIKDYDYLFKLVIIGNSGVGKSSLLLRFSDDQFNENYLTTIGVDFRFRTLNIDQKQVKLQIWDTAGQERFRTITSAYYKGADGIVIVYDVTNQSSFDDIDKFWISEVESYAEKNVEVLLIGNKIDLNAQVSNEKAKEYAKNKNMEFFEASAKTSDTVQLAFLTLTRNLIANADYI
ncbi:Ras family protein, putative [Ichthyophthirius multifiliis]|uniref:Ras family protein, putative n=1 Tax=Ichthyophthirius multifiliis TaxID=5932 RepID=G0R1D7_ICHMU|nr:Ras family protein, putative [Ichthyophthirius multifiliis]EGR28722.1 Ras family protein, putative [Ichthyophthirius multifiliis]|eukprot:XP_004029958.1 Ras family protein, putative [Ichthyophthirius multifiliis]